MHLFGAYLANLDRSAQNCPSIKHTGSKYLIYVKSNLNSCINKLLRTETHKARKTPKYSPMLQNKHLE